MNVLIPLLLYKTRSHTAVHFCFTHKNPYTWQSE